MNKLFKLIGPNLDDIDLQIKQLNLDGFIILQVVSLKSRRHKIECILLAAKKPSHHKKKPLLEKGSRK